MTNTVPFFDYAANYRPWTADVITAVQEAADSDEFILKSRVKELEMRIAERIGAGYAVAVASGTGALTLSLVALDVGPGDQVITAAFSPISVAAAIARSGARPVFADVDPETGCLDPGSAKSAITGATKALVPAYLFSNAPDMATFADLARRRGLWLIEDSAIALGARVAGRPAGRYGTLAIFSFAPSDPVGGAGHAGMLVTSDEELAHKLRMLRNHGQRPGTRFVHDVVGFNCRMNEITAGFILRRLPLLDNLLQARRALAQRYNRLLSPLAPDVLTPAEPHRCDALCTYVVRVKRREALRNYLATRGIETKVFYPRPLHLHPAFRSRGHHEGQFPVAERLSQECLALPLHPEMHPDHIKSVASAISDFYRDCR